MTDKNGRILPYSNQSVKSRAVYSGQGVATEWRFKGHPGLVLIANRPDAGGQSSRSWYCIYSFRENGKKWTRKKRIGLYPAMSLSEAAAIVGTIRSEVAAGGDPVAEAKAEQAVQQAEARTFADLVADYLGDQYRAGVKSAPEVERALTLDALPALGALPAAAVTDVQIERTVDAVLDRGSAGMARHLLAYIRGAFNHGLDSPTLRARYGLVHNPADRVGRSRRGKPGKYGRHGVKDRALDDDEIARFWRALDSSQTAPATKLVLKVLLATGQRLGEVRGARQVELKLDGVAPVWNLPGERVKNGRAHTLPLSDLAVRLFQEALSLHRKKSVVFASAQTADGTVGSDATRQVIERLHRSGRLAGARFTPHDLRRTAASGLERLGTPREVVGRILNHSPSGVTAVHYSRHDYADEMRAAMEAWASHLEGLVRS